MLPSELRHLKLIPAHRLLADLGAVPDVPGVYLLFLNGGMRLLEATAYFDTDLRMPLTARGKQHLYTGAADNLRKRLEQHFWRDAGSSSFRKTLLSIEHARCAVSKSRTPCCKISGEDTLSTWLFKNALVAIDFTQKPFERERALITRYASPFNITLRRQHPYSRSLMAWRSVAFPHWRLRRPYTFKSGSQS